jgi:tetratricopeptide (TPR) repeat protein
VAAGVVITCVYFNYALIPAAKATAKIQQANRAISVGRFEQAHKLLDYAAEDDLLSSAPLSLNGRLYLHHFELIPRANRDLLVQAEKCLRAAIERNSAAFKNYERLTEAYLLLAKVSTQQERIDWLNKAFETASLAVEHYPGCARLRIELAKIAERLDQNDIASSQYEKAIDIEDKYRDQFRKMYPEREKIVSRLGEEKYQFAKQRLKFLTDQSTP